MKHRSHGFTLLELMIVVALAAVILGIGAPNFREFLRNNRMTSVSNDLLGGIQTARSEAIKRQVATGGIAICPSDNPEAANPTCLGDATRHFNGWIAFVDADNNCDRDVATEPVVRAGARVDLGNSPTRYVKSASDGSCLSFAATGFVRNDTGRQAVSRIVFCDERGNENQSGVNLSAARGFVVTATGRARITRDKTEIGNFGIACP